jgi:hypothetical protein
MSAVITSISFLGGPTQDATSGDMAFSIWIVLLCSIETVSPNTRRALS